MLRKYGDVAHLVERSLCMREAPGSMPGISIRPIFFFFLTFKYQEFDLSMNITEDTWNQIEQKKRRKTINWFTLADSSFDRIKIKFSFLRSFCSTLHKTWKKKKSDQFRFTWKQLTRLSFIWFLLFLCY